MKARRVSFGGSFDQGFKEQASTRSGGCIAPRSPLPRGAPTNETTLSWGQQLRPASSVDVLVCHFHACVLCVPLLLSLPIPKGPSLAPRDINTHTHAASLTSLPGRFPFLHTLFARRPTPSPNTDPHMDGPALQPAQPMEDDDEHGGGHAGVEGRPGAGENTTAAKLLYKAIQEDDLETIRRLVEGKVRTGERKRGGNCKRARARGGRARGGRAGGQEETHGGFI